MRLLYSLVILLIYSTSVYAAPSVSGTSGSTSHGGSMTISGSAFGTKSPAAPLLWDDFEWGSDGTRIDTSVDWRGEDSTDPEEPEIDTSQSFGQGTRSSYVFVFEADPDEVYGTEFRPVYHDFTASTTIYVSSMNRFSHGGGAQGGGMWKMPRIVGTGGSYSQGPYTGVSYFATSDSAGDPAFYYEPGDCSDCSLTTEYDDTISDLATDTWHRIETYYVLSTPATSDGAVKYWWNYQQAPELVTAGWDNLATRSAGNTNTVDVFNSGHQYVNDTIDKMFYIWQDDVYIDDTQARVEICDASTWAARTDCAIQIPSAWSTTSATVTLNQGALASIADSYLYVIDSAGAVNSSGYSITAEAVVGTEGRTSGSGYIDELGW